MRQAQAYVICIDNSGYEASLEASKLYRTMPDREAAAHGMLRIVDETGEDYLFAADRFMPIRLTEKIRRALSTSVRRAAHRI